MSTTTEPDAGEATEPSGPLAVLTAHAERSWGRSVFGFVDAGRVRRRPSDILRLVTAVGVLATLSALASGTGRFEETLYDLLSQAPGLGRGLFRSLTTFLFLVGAGIALTAVVLRRLRLVGTILVAAALAGGVAWALAETLDVAQEREQAGLVLTNGSIPEYPALSLAVAAAGLLAAGPYLTRPARRLVDALLPLACLGIVYLLQGFPTDVIAALVLAWGASAAAHLVFGSPAGTPTTGDVADAVATLSVGVTSVSLDPVQRWGATRYTATGAGDDRLAVKVIGRDATDAQLFALLWRALWYKDARSSLAVTRLQRLEHESYLLFLAERAGARVPEVVATGVAGDREDAVLVTRLPADARPLVDLEEAEVTDATLDDGWASLGRLHSARLAHGDLGTANVLADDSGAVTLVDFSRAMAGASDGRLRLDQLALLTTTASVAGATRAVAAARRALGDDDLVALVPLLQPAALGAACRDRPEAAKALLGELRDEILTATATEAPELIELRRVNPAQIAMAVATIFGIYLLAGELSSVDDLWGTLTSADPAWVAVVIFCSQMPQFTSALAVLGAVAARLPYGRVVMLQFANGFTGLIGGTAANTALIIRFFQKQGLGPGVAVSSGVLWSIAGFITQMTLVALCILIARPDLGDMQMSTGSSGSTPWLLYLLLGGALIGVVLLIPRVRRMIFDKVRPQLEEVWANLRQVSRQPRKAAQLFGGTLGSQIFFALSLDASVHAYGSTVSFSAAVLTNSFASLVGGLAPIPGGMGVTEAGMIAGLTAAGVPQETAVAATLLHRTFTYYLPPTWGWGALEWLRRHDDL